MKYCMCGAVKLELLSAVSEKVQSEVATEILAMNGIGVPRAGQQTSVNVSVSAGYVINLSPDGSKGAEPKTIDAEPVLSEHERLIRDLG